MYDFTMDFSGLSRIPKAYREARQERTLADIGQDFTGRPIDYNVLGAKLMAAGDIRNALLALRIGAMRGAGNRRRTEPAADPDDDPNNS